MIRLYDPIAEPFLLFHRKTTEKKSSPLTPYHRHNAYEACLFLGGVRKMCIEDSCFICQPGDLFLISPEQLHAGICDEDCEYERIIMNVREDFLEQSSHGGVDLSGCFRLESPRQIKRIHLDCHKRARLIRLCGDFEKTGAKGGYGQALLAETYILQMLIFLNRWFLNEENTDSSGNVMPQVISDIMTYIREHPADGLTLEKLSKEFYFQSGYLSKMFKEYTGITVRTYLMDCKISLAKKLLSEGCTVSEACYRSGFNDYANFLRSFKNYTGISPGKYGKGPC